MEYIISEKENGILLRSFLTKNLEMSRAEITALKKRDNGIILNGIKVTVRAVLKTDDILILNRSDENASQGIIPIDLPLDIIYEDDDIIAVNKPPFMPTHPSHEHQYDTLANALAYYFQGKNIPFVFRSVNRLDRDTSGIVLIAKNKSAAFSLSKNMTGTGFDKTYIALAVGSLSSPFKIEGNIKRVNESTMKRCMCESGGQYSLTEFEPIKEYEGYTVLKAYLKTGRTHQIRVHLSSIGHPILSDTLYGDVIPSPLIKRQALHAYSLAFIHPTSLKKMTLHASLPDDMKALTEGAFHEEA